MPKGLTMCGDCNDLYCKKMQLAAATRPHPRLGFVHELLVEGQRVVQRDVTVADQRKPAWGELVDGEVHG